MKDRSVSMSHFVQKRYKNFSNKRTFHRTFGNHGWVGIRWTLRAIRSVISFREYKYPKFIFSNIMTRNVAFSDVTVTQRVASTTPLPFKNRDSAARSRSSSQIRPKEDRECRVTPRTDFSPEPALFYASVVRAGIIFENCRDARLNRGRVVKRG